MITSPRALTQACYSGVPSLWSGLGRRSSKKLAAEWFHSRCCGTWTLPFELPTTVAVLMLWRMAFHSMEVFLFAAMPPWFRHFTEMGLCGEAQTPRTGCACERHEEGKRSCTQSLQEATKGV